MYNNNSNNKLQIGGGGGGDRGKESNDELIDKINKFESLVTKIIDKFSDKLTDQYILDTKSEKIKEILKAIKLLSNKDTLKYFNNKQLQQDNDELVNVLEETEKDLKTLIKTNNAEIDEKNKELEEKQDEIIKGRNSVKECQDQVINLNNNNKELFDNYNYYKKEEDKCQVQVRDLIEKNKELLNNNTYYKQELEIFENN
jgi:chromosome segregation ATPase